MKDKYVYRHKILKYLYGKLKDEPLHRTNLKASWTNFNEIASHLKINAALLKEYHQAFHSFEKDYVACKSSNGWFLIAIQEAGVAAYLDEYFLREGEKEVNERIYDKVKWIVPIVALYFSKYTFLNSSDQV